MLEYKLPWAHSAVTGEKKGSLYSGKSLRGAESPLAKGTKPNRMTLGSAEHSGDLPSYQAQSPCFQYHLNTVLSSLDPVSLDYQC